jgi:hypothetical protein
VADIQTQRKALRAKFDQAYEDARKALVESLRALEEQQQQGSKWVEEIPDFLVPIMLGENVNLSDLNLQSHAEPPRPTNGDQPTNGDRPAKTVETFERIQLKEPIEALITGFSGDTVITSLILYDLLIKSLPALKDEDAHKLKARIAATLSKLAVENKIHIAIQGGGSVPHVYKRGPAYKPMIQNFPTETRK